jgi:SAM-dependent methyltransferase
MYETIARYYDQLHHSLTADLGFIRALVQERGGPVLELGCGSGRILLPLAQDGWQVTGIDNSLAMLALARERLAGLPDDVARRVTLFEGDIRELAVVVAGKQYSLAMLPYNTLMHFHEMDAGRLLRGVTRALLPGGRLFVDLANPFLLEAVSYPGEAVYETSLIDPDSGKPIEQWSRSSIDTQDQVLKVTWLFRPQNSDLPQQTADFAYHYLYPHQLELLLQRAGLRLKAMLGDYDGNAFAEDSERLLILADQKA